MTNTFQMFQEWAKGQMGFQDLGANRQTGLARSASRLMENLQKSDGTAWDPKEFRAFANALASQLKQHMKDHPNSPLISRPATAMEPGSRREALRGPEDKDRPFQWSGRGMGRDPVSEPSEGVRTPESIGSERGSEQGVMQKLTHRQSDDAPGRCGTSSPENGDTESTEQGPREETVIHPLLAWLLHGAEQDFPKGFGLGDPATALDPQTEGGPDALGASFTEVAQLIDILQQSPWSESAESLDLDGETAMAKMGLDSDGGGLSDAVIADATVDTPPVDDPMVMDWAQLMTMGLAPIHTAASASTAPSLEEGTSLGGAPLDTPQDMMTSAPVAKAPSLPKAVMPDMTETPGFAMETPQPSAAVSEPRPMAAVDSSEGFPVVSTAEVPQVIDPSAGLPLEVSLQGLDGVSVGAESSLALALSKGSEPLGSTEFPSLETLPLEARTIEAEISVDFPSLAEKGIAEQGTPAATDAAPMFSIETAAATVATLEPDLEGPVGEGVTPTEFTSTVDGAPWTQGQEQASYENDRGDSRGSEQQDLGDNLDLTGVDMPPVMRMAGTEDLGLASEVVSTEASSSDGTEGTISSSVQTASGQGASGLHGAGASSGPKPALQHGVMGQIAKETVEIIKQGRNEVQMRLNPEALGSVKITLTRLEAGMMSARFILERPEAFQALNESIQQLHKTLSEQGVQLERVTMVLAGRGPIESAATDGRGFGQSHQQEGQEQGQNLFQSFQGHSGQGQFNGNAALPWLMGQGNGQNQRHPYGTTPPAPPSFGPPEDPSAANSPPPSVYSGSGSVNLLV